MRLPYLKGSVSKEALDEMNWFIGWMPVETVPNPEHPLSAIGDATIQQIETAILEDRRVTEREVVSEVKISLMSV